MEFNNVINKRQSVRSFTKDEISDEDIDIILDAAKKAPVGKGNYNEYKLIVYSNNVVQELSKLSIKSLNRDILYGCNKIILVAHNGPSNEVIEQSIGCIMENMELGATNIGVDSVYVYGIRPLYLNSKEVQEILSLGEFIPEAALCLGKALNYKYIDKKHEMTIEKK